MCVKFLTHVSLLECRRLLDQIKTSCRLLLDVGNGERNRVSLSYWLGSCAVPLFIQLWPKESMGAANVKSQLKELAVHLQVITFVYTCDTCAVLCCAQRHYRVHTTA